MKKTSVIGIRLETEEYDLLKGNKNMSKLIRDLIQINFYFPKTVEALKEINNNICLSEEVEIDDFVSNIVKSSSIINNQFYGKEDE